jgi:hypothetical protein
MEVKTLFPLVIDSTFLMKFDSCMMAGFRAHIQHLSKGNTSTDLVAGKAFARGLEVTRKAFYNDGVKQSPAIDLGIEALYEDYGDHDPWSSVKTAEKMASALELYFMEYPMATDHLQPARLADGTYAIEYSFCHELPFKHPDLDCNLLITGRADMVATYGGKLWVSDEKTTKAFSGDWAQSWDTRGQFTTYAWGLAKDGIDVSGAFIRGVALQKTNTKFAECMTSRSKFEVETWEFQMLAKVKRILDAYNAFKTSGEHPSRHFFGAWNEACMAYFRPCSFMELCRSKSSENFIEGEWGQEIWLPHEQRRENLDIFLESVGYGKE